MTSCYCYSIYPDKRGHAKVARFLLLVTLCSQQNHLNLHEPAVWYCYSARVVYLQILQMIIVR